MVLSSRQYALLKILLDSAQPISSEALCRELKCSARTLRYEISTVNDSLRSKLIVSSRNGYQMNKKADIKSCLKKLNFDNYRTMAGGALEYLIDKGSVSILDLCEDLYVSESTAAALVKKQVNPVLERYSLKIETKNGRFVLSGKERDIRRLIVEQVFSGKPIQSFFAAMQDGSAFGAELSGVLDELLDRNEIQLDDIYLQNFRLYVEVSLRRIATGHFMEKAEDPEQRIAFADELFEEVYRRYGITVNNGDAAYITSLFRGYFKDTPGMASQEEILNNGDFRQKIETALETTGRHFNITLDYSQLFDSIVLHCYYLLVRLREETRLHNVITADLKYKNPFVYELSVYMVFLLEQMFEVSIPYEETGLLAVYLGALLDASDSAEDKVRVVCVCPRYNNLRVTVENQINNLLKPRVEIVKFVSTLRHVKPEDEYDLIISLEQENSVFSEKKIVYISPIITPSSYFEIEQSILQIIKDRRDREIRALMERYLDKELFFVCEGGEEQSGMDVLLFLNERMMSKEIIGADFLPNVLAREKLATTAFFQKFAIPHALNIKSNDTKIAYYYSEKPVNWFGTRVNLIVLLTAREYDESFSKLYEFIFYIMTNNDLYHQMVKCSTFEELSDFFRTYF